MTKQEYTKDMAQADQESVAVPWVMDIASRPGSIIALVEPDLKEHPGQDVDEYVTWAAEIPAGLSDEDVLKIGHGVLVQAIGGNEADQVKYDLQNLPADPEAPNGPVIIERIINDVDAGKNLISAASHHNHVDVGVMGLAVALAAERPRMARQNNFIAISPIMKYAAVDGVYIPEKLQWVGNEVWDWPLTKSSSKRDIPRRLRLRAGRGVKGVMEPIISDPKRGTVTYVALHESGLETEVNELGEVIGLSYPEVFDAAAGKLRYADSVFAFPFYFGPDGVKWSIGPFVDRASIEAETESDRDLLLMDIVTQDQRARLQKLAGVPVKYARSERVETLLAAGLTPTS